MKAWIWIMLCLACPAMAACRANPHRTALEQESRLWEDRFYIVQDRLEECENMLEAALHRNQKLQESAAGTSGNSGQSAPGAPHGIAPPSIEGIDPDRFQPMTPDSLESSSSGDGGGDEFEPPRSFNNQGDLPDAPSYRPPGLESPPAHGEPRRLDAPILPELEPEDAPYDHDSNGNESTGISDDSREVAAVEIIGMAADGFDEDGRGRADGVQFVLQPRDSRGRAIDAAGPISVVVVDPMPDGKAQRIARWDLTARQAAGYYDRAPRGFHLRLPWPAAEPENSRLKLFARYTTSDGRKLEADKAIDLNLGDGGGPRELEEKIARSAPPRQPRVAVQPRRQRPTVDTEYPNSETQRSRPVWSPER